MEVSQSQGETASAQQTITTDLQSFAKCPICNGVFSNPRFLPCIHTFCLTCLEGYIPIESAQNPNSLSCPVCTKVFPVPEGGLLDLPLNTFVKRLSSGENENVEDSHADNLCETCAQVGETVSVVIRPAELSCVDCKLKLCRICADSHKNNETNKLHRIIRFGRAGRSESISRRSLEDFCAKHNDDIYRLYCKDCQEAICFKCFVDSHQQHKCVEISGIEAELHQHLKDNLKSLDEYVEQYRKYVEDTENDVDIYDEELAEVVKSVDKYADELKQRVDQDRKALQMELILGKEWKKLKMEGSAKDLKRNVEIADALKKYVAELNSKGTPIDVALQTRSIQRYATELLQFKAGSSPIANRLLHASFSPANHLKQVEGNVIGSISLILEESSSDTRADSADGSTSGTTELTLISCPSCHSLYKDPRYLPCMHTFCLNCLPTLQTEGQDRKSSIICMLCKKMFPTPDIGLEGFPKNLFIKKLTQIRALRLNSLNRLQKCDNCSSSSSATVGTAERKFASFYCAECQKKLCDSCELDHRKSDAGHPRACFDLLKDSRSTEDLMELLEIGCEKHVGESLTQYCYNCALVVCAACVNQEHQTHRLASIKSVQRKFRRQLTVDVEILQTAVKNLRENLRILKEAKDRNSFRVHETQQAIHRQAAAVRAIVDRDEKQLLQKIESSRTTEIGKVEKFMSALVKYVFLRNILKLHLEELRNKGSVVDVAREAAVLKRATEDTRKFYHEDVLAEVESLAVTFVPAKILLPQLSYENSELGKVDVTWIQEAADGRWKSVRAAVQTAGKKTPEDIIRCLVCEDIYKDPRSLPCHHVVCFQCLKDVKQDHRRISCPICHVMVSLPHNRIEELPESPFIRKLIRLRHMTQVPENKNLCEQCSANDEDDTDTVDLQYAEEYCVDCNLRLCKGCKYVHQKSNGKRRHTLEKISSAEDNNDGTTDDICQVHEGEKLTIFCHKCERVLCVKCTEESHLGHRSDDVRSIERELKRQVTNCINSLTGELDAYQSIIKETEAVKDRIVHLLSSVEQSVRDEADRLKCYIDQSEEILVTVTSHRRRLGNIESGIDDINHQISLSELLINYLEELLINGMGVDFARQVKSLRAAAKDLSSYESHRFVSSLGSLTANFTASKQLSVPPNRNVVGELHQKREIHHIKTLPAVSYETKTPAKMKNQSAAKLVGEIPSDKTVRALTVLGDLLAVVRKPTGENIEIYDSESFKRLESINVHGLGRESFGLASCDTYYCFYVSDFYNDAVHRIKMSPPKTGSNGTRTSSSSSSNLVEVKRIDKWLTFGAPMGLSVTKSRDVLVTYSKVGYIHQYSTRGAFIRRIPLQSDIINVREAFQIINNGQSVFVVCHGDRDDPLHRVCVVNNEGQILSKYGSRPGPELKQLNMPVSIAYAAGNKNILVADRQNNRIVMLQLVGIKFDGTDACDLLAPTGVKVNQPCAICLEESNDFSRLFIGETDGRVLVMRFSTLHETQS